MRLYLFEHCSVCFRVRMAAALKRLHLQETVVLEDDSDTPIVFVDRVCLGIARHGYRRLHSDSTITT